jgi:hypothetical protein
MSRSTVTGRLLSAARQLDGYVRCSPAIPHRFAQALAAGPLPMSVHSVGSSWLVLAARGGIAGSGPEPVIYAN